jgi:hypothetical protein
VWDGSSHFTGFKMPDGTTTVILQGKKPSEIDTVTSEDPYWCCYQKILLKIDQTEDSDSSYFRFDKELAIQIRKIKHSSEATLL